MVLAQRCGETFIRSLAENGPEDEYGCLDQAMFHWIRHDPQSVIGWLDHGDLPEVIVAQLDGYREDALDELAE